MRLNRILNLLILPVFVALFSCETEQHFPVSVDFTIKVVDDNYITPARVEIKNETTGADYYQWVFEGAHIESSIKREPGALLYLKGGEYVIQLKASNKDGEEDEKSITLQFEDLTVADFDWQQEGSDFAPVKLNLQNKSTGGDDFLWEIDNGQKTSKEKDWEVVFDTPGVHHIKLMVSNDRVSDSIVKTIEVQPGLEVGFDWSVDFIDEDYEAPVTLFLENHSQSAVEYRWKVNGAEPAQSSEEEPVITFNTPGKYDIELTASNDKETKTVEKSIEIKPNKNLLVFKDIQLGINTAHATIGSFFASHLGRVVTREEVNEENGQAIDLVYFGMDDSFSQNQFVSPDDLEFTSFSDIPNALSVYVINRIEASNLNLSPAEFENIDNGDYFNSMAIRSQSGAINGGTFGKEEWPRIVLLETADGRKGAVKIKSFVKNGRESYILVDIKIQKQ